MNLFTKQKQHHGCIKLNYGYQRIRGKGVNWEIGADIYPYIKQITNKSLMYNTGKSTQYSVMASMGKNLKRRVDMCICITGSLYYTPEINTTL